MWQVPRRLPQSMSPHEASAAVVTAYYVTATTALCAPPARVLEFDRFLHSPLTPLV